MLRVTGGQLGGEGRRPGSGARAGCGQRAPGSPARMKSRSWKAVRKRVSAMRLSWASRARKARQLSRDRRPAPTAKLQATLLLLSTQWSCGESVWFW